MKSIFKMMSLMVGYLFFKKIVIQVVFNNNHSRIYRVFLKIKAKNKWTNKTRNYNKNCNF